MTEEKSYDIQSEETKNSPQIRRFRRFLAQVRISIYGFFFLPKKIKNNYFDLFNKQFRPSGYF